MTDVGTTAEKTNQWLYDSEICIRRKGMELRV